jgi:hypothetical protein
LPNATSPRSKAQETQALRYHAGEEIHLGDRVTYAGRPSTVELVVVRRTGVAAEDWHFDHNGTGVMVVESEPTLFGRVYLHRPEDEEDLVLVSRANAP